MKNVAKLTSQYRTVFGSPDGEAVLADLRREFYDRPLLGDNPTTLAAKTGSHYVVRYILDTMEDRDE